MNKNLPYLVAGLFVGAVGFFGDAKVSADSAPAQAPVYPNSVLTPGATDPRVTQANIKTTICVPGYTAKVRATTAETKQSIYIKYGMLKARTGYCATPHGCEIDHLISLEIGGADVADNLWPQSYDAKMGAHQKDAAEDELHRRVCDGRMSLEDAQAAIKTDWVAAHQKYVGQQ